MSRCMLLRGFSVTTLISRMLIITILLISLGHSQSLTDVYYPFNPPIRDSMTAECSRILSTMTSSTFMPLGLWRPNSSYRVLLKPFTSHADTLEILKMPPLRSVVPTTLFDQAKDRGFVAKLTDEQLCYIYKISVVNTISKCPISCEPPFGSVPYNCSDPKLIPERAFPEPSLSPAIKNAPNITGLTADCAKIVWYNLALLMPSKAPGDVAVDYVVTFKPTTTKEQAMNIMYSEEAKGTNFKAGEETMWRNNNWPKTYMGQWNFTQLCYLEHRPEISHVGVSPLQHGLYGGYLEPKGCTS